MENYGLVKISKAICAFTSCVSLSRRSHVMSRRDSWMLSLSCVYFPPTNSINSEPITLPPALTLNAVFG